MGDVDPGVELDELTPAEPPSQVVGRRTGIEQLTARDHGGLVLEQLPHFVESHPGRLHLPMRGGQRPGHRLWRPTRIAPL